MAENEFDYKGYEQSLEKVLSSAEKDYWAQYIDVNRHQVNVAKTYLWVAVALLGAYAATYQQYKEVLTSASVCSILLMVLSVICAVLSFGICLYAIPARKGYRSIANPSWGEFSQKAHELLSQKKSNLYISTLTLLIDRVDVSANHNVITNQKRAKLLRITSWILIISFTFSLLSVMSLALSNFEIIKSPNQTTETTMSPENESNQSETPATPSQPTADTPDVPTPAGPIGQGTDQPNITTHGLRPTGTIRVTESADGDGNSNGE